MENNNSDCQCGSADYMVLACSGACDLGHVTDLAARKLRDNGIRKMNCLASVATGLQKTIEDFKSKDILLIDGCPLDCGKQILDKVGISGYKYLRLTDLGYIKGQTPVNEDVINAVYGKAELIF